MKNLRKHFLKLYEINANHYIGLTSLEKFNPKLIMIDAATFEVMDTYGSRPTTANKMVEDYKKEHGKLTPEFKENLQRWYNKDKGKTAVKDLTELLKKHTPSFSL